MADWQGKSADSETGFLVPNQIPVPVIYFCVTTSPNGMLNTTAVIDLAHKSSAWQGSLGKDLGLSLFPIAPAAAAGVSAPRWLISMLAHWCWLQAGGFVRITARHSVLPSPHGLPAWGSSLLATW